MEALGGCLLCLALLFIVCFSLIRGGMALVGLFTLGNPTEKKVKVSELNQSENIGINAKGEGSNVESQSYFEPRDEGESSDQACNSGSSACQHWKYLAQKCEENMALRESGYVGDFKRYYCSEAAEFRERVTGIPYSGSPGAFDF